MRPAVDLAQEFPELLVPFEASHVPGAQVIYSNGMLKDSVFSILENYAYVVSEDSSKPQRVFFAERYGGGRILNNGGGGRCGIGKNYQVKGIGPTPMVGRDTRRAHADGNLTLTSAIYETLWALIMKTFLPYDAIGTQHIIALPSDETMGNSRALILRDQHLRLAHFQRALYFRSEIGGALDATRVRVAVKKVKDKVGLKPFVNGPFENNDMEP